MMKMVKARLRMVKMVLTIMKHRLEVIITHALTLSGVLLGENNHLIFDSVIQKGIKKWFRLLFEK